MQVLVTAAFSSAIPKNAPGEIVYIPVGSSKITPSVDGKPKAITVNASVERGEAIAASLQQSLDKRLSGSVRPFLAFDHARTGPAAGIPKSFRFDPKVGIILALDWSTKGRSAIEGDDYGYFSPSFMIDDKGEPAGLPERGEIGSLVNEPAFRDIGLIAAADAQDSHPKQNSQMKSICAALNINPDAADAESVALASIQAKDASIATLTAENTRLKTEAEAVTKARHEGLVTAAVTAGKIAPKDEETKTQALELLKASDALGAKFLEALPVRFSGLDTTIVREGEKRNAGAEGRVEAAQAKARAELGANAGFSEVWARAAEIDPPAFHEAEA